MGHLFCCCVFQLVPLPLVSVFGRALLPVRLTEAVSRLSPLESILTVFGSSDIFSSELAIQMLRWELISFKKSGSAKSKWQDSRCCSVTWFESQHASFMRCSKLFCCLGQSQVVKRCESMSLLEPNMFVGGVSFSSWKLLCCSVWAECEGRQLTALLCSRAGQSQIQAKEQPQTEFSENNLLNKILWPWDGEAPDSEAQEH